MRVFNLTGQTIDFRGVSIPAYDSRDIEISFIPDRDRVLEKNGILAFGALPKNWKRPVEKAPVVAPKLGLKELPKVEKEDPLPVTEEPKEMKEEKKQEGKKKHN